MDFLQAMAQGRYQEGRVVDLRSAADKDLFLIGDIHAKASRIQEIFSHADLHARLQKQEAVVVFLGDLFHREEHDRAGEMESSIETFEILMDLKRQYPDHLYALLGNHEFTRTERCKQGYFQGQLFRQALEDKGWGELYEQFVAASPLVVIHPHCVGVHAAPARSVRDLQELRSLPLSDGTVAELHPAVIELTCQRHTLWSPSHEKAYTDYDVDDFLILCGVPGTHLITGHTPLNRDTGWKWPMGPRNTVIFAAGREVGYVQAQADGLRFVRLGRSLLHDDDQLRRAEASETPVWLREPSGPRILARDVPYRFDYGRECIEIRPPEGQSLRLCHYRHLSASSQAYYAMGHYLVGHEMRQQILKLRRDDSLLLGPDEMCDGVRLFSDAWPEETLILRQFEPGQFEILPLIEGVVLEFSEQF